MNSPIGQSPVVGAPVKKQHHHHLLRLNQDSVRFTNENTQGLIIGALLSNAARAGGFLRRSLLPGASNQAPAALADSRLPIPLTGLGYDIAKEVLELPMSRYDTKAIIRERNRQVDELHDNALAGRPVVSADIDTPERKALRDSIVDQMYGSGAAKQDRQAYVIMAAPAVGKSTISVGLVKEHGALDIDADTPLEYMPEWAASHNGLYTNQERAQIVHRVYERAVNNGDNIILNLVASQGAPEVKAQLQDLKARGYDVHLSLLELPLDKAVGRLENRWKETGRFIDPAIETHYYRGPRQAFNALKKTPLVDSYRAFSTDVERGQPARLMESSDPTERLG